MITFHTRMKTAPLWITVTELRGLKVQFKQYIVNSVSLRKSCVVIGRGQGEGVNYIIL